MCNHNQDFGAEAEWHFSATAHGKGSCNGLGATVKRLAARASLQRPYKDQIMDAKQLLNGHIRIYLTKTLYFWPFKNTLKLKNN